MPKHSTPINITQLGDLKKVNPADLLNPSNESISKIMQFAASYRAEKTSKSSIVEYFLN